MNVTAWAVLLQLKPLRVVLFVFDGGVVPLLAVYTGQRDDFVFLFGAHGDYYPSLLM
jgi:hypothetical protein